MMKKLKPCASYGVWNAVAKEFQFGIKTEKIEHAEKALKSKIGHDSKKYRFEIKCMNNENLVNLHNFTQIEKQKQRIRSKEMEINALARELEDFRNK
jgi:hypothetical protein